MQHNASFFLPGVKSWHFTYTRDSLLLSLFSNQVYETDNYLFSSVNATIEGILIRNSNLTHLDNILTKDWLIQPPCSTQAKLVRLAGTRSAEVLRFLPEDNSSDIFRPKAGFSSHCFIFKYECLHYKCIADCKSQRKGHCQILFYSSLRAAHAGNQRLGITSSLLY